MGAQMKLETLQLGITDFDGLPVLLKHVLSLCSCFQLLPGKTQAVSDQRHETKRTMYSSVSAVYWRQKAIALYVQF